MNEQKQKTIDFGTGVDVDKVPVTHDSEIWRLTVSTWEHVPENLKPIEASYLFPKPADPNFPAYFFPKKLLFNYPPTREDFIGVLKRYAWSKNLLDRFLEFSPHTQWPVICAGYKGASSEIINANGRVVGQLEVWRETLYESKNSNIPTFWESDYNNNVNKIRQEFLKKYRLLIAERIQKFNRSITDMEVRAIIDDVKRIVTGKTKGKKHERKTKTIQ